MTSKLTDRRVFNLQLLNYMQRCEYMNKGVNIWAKVCFQCHHHIDEEGSGEAGLVMRVQTDQMSFADVYILKSIKSLGIFPKYIIKVTIKYFYTMIITMA